MYDNYIFCVMIFGTLLSTSLQTFFYYKTIGFPKQYKIYHLVLIIVSNAILKTFLLGSFTIFTEISMYFVMFMYPIIFMGGKLRERIFFSSINLLILRISNVLGVGVMSFKFLWDSSSAIAPTKLLISAIIVNIIYIILLVIIIKLGTFGKFYIPDKYWTVINCFCIFFVFIVTMIYSCANLFVIESELFLFTVLFTFIVIIICVFLYVMFCFLCKYFVKVNETTILSVQNDMVEKYMLQKQMSDNQIKILSHDLKHNLVNLYNIAKQKGDQTSIDTILEYENQLKSFVLINVCNESINSIINQKYLDANKLQIEFLVDGIFYDDLVISNLDLCSLVGNLLDNSFEAVIKVENKALRFVKFLIKRKGKLLMLIIENGYAVEPIIINGKFITSKADKQNHEIGMVSINHIVEKYNGIVKNTYENNIFKVSIVLNGYNNLLSDEN